MTSKPTTLKELFEAKAAKKKGLASNLNGKVCQKKDPPPKPILARTVAAEGGDAAADGWTRALRRDQELLKACSLWIKEVEADGACLFRAFADQIDGDGGASHAAYRERCVDFMRAERQDFEPFLEEDFDQYCKRMRAATTWGGHVEAQAMARCLGVNALIYRPAEAGEPGSLERSTVEILTSETEDCRCVQLSFHPTHHAGQHYNSVRCADDDGKGPAPAASVAELRRRVEESLRPKEVAAPAVEEEAEEPPSKSKSRSSARVF